MSKDNHFVLIVATRNRPKDLARFLHSISEQEYKNCEVVVVDQSSDDFAFENGELIRSLAEKISVRYKRSSAVGLSRARNEGLALVRHGDIIAFPDDDCWYHPTLLRLINERFKTNPSVNIWLGQYAEPSLGYNERFPQQPRAMSPATAFGSSVGLFFSARVFLETKIRFDERIGVGTDFPAAEELDVLIRALFTGYTGYYDPGIVVYHPIKQRSTHPTYIRAREAAHFYVFAKYLSQRDPEFTMKVIRRSLVRLFRAVRKREARYQVMGMVDGLLLALRTHRREGKSGVSGKPA